jgi:hypothetical protein
MPDLTPDEVSFFETGELPAALAAQATPVVAEPAVAPLVVPPASVVVPKIEENDALERMLNEERQSRAALEAKFADLEAKLLARNTLIEEVPDQNTDPLGNMMHQLNQLNKAVVEMKTNQTQQEQQSSLRTQLNEFTQSVQAAKTTFESTTPDFKDAYAHIRALRTEDLRAVGATDAQISQVLLQDEFQLAQHAIQRGKNPAEEMYAMAKRYGYASKVAAAAVANPAQKMEQLKVGTAADHNLGRAGIEAELTLEGIKDLSNNDLNKLIQDDKMWQTLVGGKQSHELI